MHANVKSSCTDFCTYISVAAEIAAIVTGAAIPVCPYHNEIFCCRPAISNLHVNPLSSLIYGH